MVTLVRRWLATPSFADEETQRTASALQTILLVGFVLAPVGGIVGVAMSRAQIDLLVTLVVVGISLLFFSFVMWLLHSGRVRAAAALVAGGVWVMAVVLSLASGGVRGAGSYIYITAILIAGMVLGWRVGVVFVALSALAGLVMLYAERVGLLPPPVMARTSFGWWVTQVANLVWVAHTILMYTKRINDALGRANRNNRELQAVRASLEERVVERTADLSATNRQLQQEIAERKEADERYRGIFENAVLGLYRTTPDGRILAANPALLRMLGFSSFEALAQRKLEENEGYEPQYPRSAFVERIERDGQIVGLESAWKRQDGATLFVRESARVIRDADGRTLYYEGTVEDIAERKRAENGLRRSHQRLEMLHEIDHAILAAHSPAEIAQAALNRIRELVPCLHACIALFDLETNTFSVLAINVNGVPRLAPGTALPLEQFGDIEDLRQGKVLVVENLLSLPHFSEVQQRWWAEGVRSCVCIPLFVRGELIGVLNLGADQPGGLVAEHVEITREVADQLAIAIRHSQLYQELQRVNDELRQMDRMKSEFVSNVSHELRTPLTTILGYTELLQNAPGMGQSALEVEGLRTVYSNGQRLLRLVNDLLDVSRLESGKFAISPAHLEPAPLLRQLVEEVRLMADKKGLTLAADLPDDLPRLTADGPRVAQVLNNLLSNAIKFTPAGGTVQVRGCESEQPDGAGPTIAGLPDGKWLVVSVADTGIGIPPEELPSLFSRFHRTVEAQHRAIRGTGIGLYVAKAIIEAHGGHIGVESQVGRGSTFWFALPLAPAVLADAERSRAVAEADLPV